MSIYFEPLRDLNDYNEMCMDLERNRVPLQVTGCIDSQKCHIMAGLAQNYPFKLIITYSEQRAKEICEDYRLYDKNVFLYPAKDIIFYNADIRGYAIVKERLKAMKKLLNREPVTVVTTIDGGMDRVLPMSFLAEHIISVRDTDMLDLDKLQEKLIGLGYERQGQVETPGEFAVRGGIIDIYPLTEEAPVRIELWGDEIDSIRTFDAESQRSIENITGVDIFPAAEIILDDKTLQAGVKRITEEEQQQISKLRGDFKTEESARLKKTIAELKENLEYFHSAVGLDGYVKYFYDDTVSFFDYFMNEDSIIFIDEPSRVEERGLAVTTEFSESMIMRLEKGYILPGQMDVLFDYKHIFAGLAGVRTILVSTMDYKFGKIPVARKYDLTVRSMNPYNSNFELLVKQLKEWKKNGYKTVLLSGSKSRAMRLADDLKDFELMAFFSDNNEHKLQSGEIMVAYGNLRKGFEYPLLKLAIVSESDIFGAEKKKKKNKHKQYTDGSKIQDLNGLSIGDYVVHENHGLGIYRGIEKIVVDKIEKDYIKLEYAGGGVLYILATGLDIIQKYANADAKKVKLNKLNSIEWKNTKARVRSAVKELAFDLVSLYALRQQSNGHAYGRDTVWQKEFEELFPYEETDDQLKAIEETKKDMESTKIMDRLICGDVGYGKTEIAIRAAFKAVSDGYQVVFLVPTTILAQQHYNTFTQRMKDFPVSIDMLSRFKTPAEQKKIITRAKNGQLDILIGTHRVLSKDISFKQLGLLIVDEEQRFGVGHKEKIKHMKGDVDVLTLTATPIPRTLHMSLIGIRDMSVLDEAPVDRVPIQTFVMEKNEEMIREAVTRELARGGQVYYVYNRVQGIEDVAAMVSKLVPDAVVAYAHGQMAERQLEKIMYDFINGEIDILVSTTIIETGLDISNVNTMIIDDADKLGLSQLYQLRGRVGRSNRTAYAFLMYKRDKMLKEIAEKRLSAIREFTELGSGFKIAMRDLEIRGAGNLLGAEQSGHMEAVGYDLYCKMLNEAVKTLKGDMKPAECYETSLDVDINAFIPSTYIKNEMQKLDMYKKIANIESKDELIDMQEELTDRFGEVPESVNNLLYIALYKARAHALFITSLAQKEKVIKISFYPKAELEVAQIPQLLGLYEGKLKMIPGQVPSFEFYPQSLAAKRKTGKPPEKEILKDIGDLLENMEKLLAVGASVTNP